jgi:hypothetical protein
VILEYLARCVDADLLVIFILLLLTETLLDRLFCTNLLLRRSKEHFFTTISRTSRRELSELDPAPPQIVEVSTDQLIKSLSIVVAY